MLQKPRSITSSFFNWNELFTSVIQGLAITVGVLTVYQIAVGLGSNESITRTMVFTTLITSNVLLTFVNRSFIYSIFTTFKYKNNLVPIIVGITLGIITLLLFVPTLTRFFQFERISASQIGVSVGIGFLSVIWYEVVKFRKRQIILKKSLLAY